VHRQFLIAVAAHAFVLGVLWLVRWERDRDLKGGIDSIVENDNADGPVVLQVAATDKVIKTDGCSTLLRS
jgi:hypothetical protein